MIGVGDLIARAKKAGLVFMIDGERVRYRLPKPLDIKNKPLVDEIRRRRDEIVNALLEEAARQNTILKELAKLTKPPPASMDTAPDERCRPRFDSYLDGRRLRYNLLIPFNGPKKYHWWNGGQSVTDTAAELVLNEMLERKIHQGEKQRRKPDAEPADRVTRQKFRAFGRG